VLTALSADHVGDMINNLAVEVVDPHTRKRVVQPAMRGTKRRCKTALVGVWSHVHPHIPAPFSSAKIALEKVGPTESTRVNKWEDESILKSDGKTGALEPSEVFRLLVAAVFLERWRAMRGNIRGRYIPNTVYSIVLQIALGLRVSELLMLRWGHLLFRKRYVIVHNAKVQQVIVTLRAVPLQTTLCPWLHDFRGLEESMVTPNTFIVRTNPSEDPEEVQGAQTTIGRRTAQALELAGLKIPHKATHGLRATFASHCDASPDINQKTTSKYLGHYKVYGTSTDKYVTQMVELMRPSHRELIQLPSPADINAAVDAQWDELSARWADLRAKRPEESDD